MVHRTRLSRKSAWIGKLKTRLIKNDVFAVHGWETMDGKHSVHVWNNKGRMTTKVFKDWEDAEDYAQKSALRLGKTSYQVDTPSRPHVMVRIPETRLELLKKGKSVRPVKWGVV